MLGFDPLTMGSLLILAASPAPSICPPPPAARINVVPKARDIKYDYSRTMASLQSQETDTIDPYGFHGVTMTQGFMQGQIKMTPHVKVNYKHLPKYDAFCLWYETINIEIEIDPTIVIAKEVYEDPCMLRAVKEHELKHVKVDRAIVNKYSKIMGKKVYDALSERGFSAGPVRTEAGQEIVDRMQKVVFQVVDHEYQKMGLERTDKQREVDNLQEYERVNAQCPAFQAKRDAMMDNKKKR